MFALATSWLPRLPVRDRLVLATRAVEAEDRLDTGIPDTAPDTGAGPADPAVWTDASALLWQADLLQQALIDRIVDDTDPFIDVTQLRPSGLELAAAMKEAGALLRQQHMQPHRDRAKVDPMVLPESAPPESGQPESGPPGPGAPDDRRLSLAQLRAARDLGAVQELVTDMAGRAAAVATASAPGAGRWAVRWEPSGRFQAQPTTRPPAEPTTEPPGEPGEAAAEPAATADPTAGAPAVVGWAAHPAVVADELGRWSSRPGAVEISWPDGPPSTSIPRLHRLPAAGVPTVADERAGAAFWAGQDRLTDLLASIDALRRSCPSDRIAEQVAARAARLQATEPQLPDVLGGLFEDSAPWACTTAAEWVAARAVVHTADPVWAAFDRDDPDRRAYWLPDRTRALLAAPYAEVPAFLADLFAVGRGVDAVRLSRIPGPAGPLYSAGADGTRRSHLCRILGLPWMFAVTTMASLPRRLETTAVTPAEQGPDACRATARLWRGLLDRGVVRGELVTRHSDWIVELRIDHAPAPWILLPADRAAAYNQRYELLYPGALAAAGIPDAALRGPGAWRSWLTGTSG